MAFKRWIQSLLLAAVISLLAACSSTNSQNPPPPPPNNPTIVFQPAPITTMLVNTTATLTAVVTNDPQNAGVTWAVSCPNVGNCGQVSPAHTDSGQPTTYTPPTSLPGNSETVNIVAFATASSLQNVVAPINITAFGTFLQGTYVLEAQGTDDSAGAYEFAGVVVFDGNGGIVSGEQTVNFFDSNPDINALVTRQDPITGGNYFVGGDGRGTITINTADSDVGNNGTETFSFVALSDSQGLIAQTNNTASATGTMDLQTSTTAPIGGYAFVVNGTDIATASPQAFGGVFNIDSPKTISGNGSVTDQNLAGFILAKQKLSGTVSDPDSFGAVTIDLTAGFASGPIQFTGYIVDGTHIKLIESDNSSGVGTGSTAGVAIGQGAATGTFLDDTSFTGTYVSGILGVDLTGFTPDTLTSVSVFTADGSGNLTNGTTDTFLQQNGNQGLSGAQISGQFTGAYSIDNKGTGRVAANFSHFSPRPTPGSNPKFFFYLTGNGNPPLVLDASDLNYPSVGIGIAYPQSGPLTFGGNYGFAVVQQNGSENDGTGQFTADNPSKTLSGFLDLNAGFSATFGTPLTGTFTAPANGRFSATMFDPPVAIEYYIIDANHGFFIETDLVDPNFPTSQVTLGYYATRTPVCEGCQSRGRK